MTKVRSNTIYSGFQMAIKYIRYYYKAANGKGHGTHSPFVFDFIQNVLSVKTLQAGHRKIETRRKNLLKDHSFIEVEDMGARSGLKTSSRKISSIAATSLKPAKYARLLNRIVNYYHPEILLEMGTSFGITTAYLAIDTTAKVYSLEGAASVAEVADETFRLLNINNIHLRKGRFEHTLPKVLSEISGIDFAFIDGNHSKLPTLDYFSQLLGNANENTILVFDDIHWSTEMEEAWKKIQDHQAVTLTIDLFFIGIVFLRSDFKVKQHFCIRF